MISEYEAVAPFASVCPSHSTPPALSTGSPTTVLSKLAALAAAAAWTLPQTSVSAPPNGSAW